jgi:hypothetical protein
MDTFETKYEGSKELDVAVKGFIQEVEQSIQRIASQKGISSKKVIDIICSAFLYGRNAGGRGLSNEDCRNIIAGWRRKYNS